MKNTTKKTNENNIIMMKDEEAHVATLNGMVSVAVYNSIFP